MRQKAAGITTRISFATLGHFVLLKVVQKLARLTLFAAIVEPVTAHHSAMNGFKCVLLLRIICRYALKFKFGQAVHLHVEHKGLVRFWTDAQAIRYTFVITDGTFAPDKDPIPSPVEKRAAHDVVLKEFH